MTKEIWINLPVRDINRSREFYQQLGFSPNPRYPDSDEMASFVIGEQNVVLMLFKEDAFREFTDHAISDTGKGTEVLFSIDAGSREEVDEMARRAAEAGGTVYGAPGEKDDWMYGTGFIDPDGHRWSVLHMDRSKMPEKQASKQST